MYLWTRRAVLPYSRVVVVLAPLRTFERIAAIAGRIRW